MAVVKLQDAYTMQPLSSKANTKSQDEISRTVAALKEDNDNLDVAGLSRMKGEP